MKILRTHIRRLLLLMAMLSGSLCMVAQPVFNSSSTPINRCANDDIDCQDVIYIGNQNTPGTTVSSDTYSSGTILHSDGKVDGTSTVNYKSNYVRLDIGFSTEVGADFSAEIEACVETNTGQGGENPNTNCPETLYVGNDNTPGATIFSNLYQAGQTLESDGTIAIQDIVRQKAGHQINLKPGFKALKGSVFRGYIDPCSDGASAGTYYVNDASQIGDIYTTAPGSNSTGNGTASKPFATLKYVIQTQVLTGGDIIYIDSGIYDDTFVEINNPINNLIVKGAGAYNTIFDNNYTDNDIETDNVSNGNLFMRIYADDILLEGFTVREYNYLDMDANVNGLDGKAISVKGAECVVFDGINITQNAGAEITGGKYLSSMFIHSGSVDILNSLISYNQSPIEGIEGGGIEIHELDGAGANVNIINSIISDNIRGNRQGGGIAISGKHSVYIDNSTISNNTAYSSGGGIFIPGLANLNINNSCISNNRAINAEKSTVGGGIYIRNDAGVNIYNTVFDSNTTQGGNSKGGAIYSSTLVKLDLCKFEDNQAVDGPHIYTGGRLDINETQFLSETDAIYNFTGATLYIQNSGTPETSFPINFINNNPPQNYATPSCANTIDCIADAGFDKVICTGESVQIGAEPEEGFTYTWNPITGLSNPNIANPIASPSETTTYTLYISGCGRGSQDEITVYVSDGNITFPANQVTCSGANVPLVIHGGAEYEWTPTGGLNCADCPNPIANVTETTTYTATVTDENGCEVTGSVTITIAGTLAVTVQSDDEDRIICPGQQVQLTAQGAMDYTWSATSGGFSNPNIANPIVTPTESTTYSVVGFQDECMSENQITLTLAPEYEVGFTATPDICAINLMADNNSLNDYQWSVDGIVIEEATDIYDYSYGISHNGTYNICLMVIGMCGEEVTTCENVYVDNCICLDADIFDCPQHSVNIGHPCDDNNANTYGDMYMDDCVCRGVDCNLVEITDPNTQPTPSAINYGTLNYDGTEVTDYLIEWEDEDGVVVFTSAAGIYYNPLFHESHPPMSDIPIAAGVYTPVVVQSSLPGVLECTLPSYTVNNYTCTGEEFRVEYEGPPGVTREIEIDWAGNSDCGLHLDLYDYDLEDYVTVLGIDANGGEALLFESEGNDFEDIITIQGNYESVIIQVTSNTGDGDNTKWYLDFSCCTDVCCNVTYDLNVAESLTECGDCMIFVSKSIINPDNCEISGSIGSIIFQDELDCTEADLSIPCTDMALSSTMILTTGQAVLQLSSINDYNHFKNLFLKFDTGEYSEYSFRLKDATCNNDGNLSFFYPSVTHLDDISYDIANKRITINYADYDSCSDCIYYDYFDDYVRNISPQDVISFTFESIPLTRRIKLKSPSTNYTINKVFYYESPGCDGRLDYRKLRLEIQDQNCPCESWILKQDTNVNGTYDTVVEEAAGWSGTCSQP